MHSHRFLVAVIAALVATLAGAPGFAHAGGYEDNPAVIRDSRSGASAWRFVAHDDESTTALCIGDLTTPACAVETFHACIIRGGGICHASIVWDKMAAGFAHGSPAHEVRRYRIITVRRLTSATAAPRQAAEIEPLRPIPGDVDVTHEWKTCFLPGPRCVPGRPWTTHFIVRQFGPVWRVVLGRTERLD